MGNHTKEYRLERSSNGSALLGLSLAQVSLLAVGFTVLAVVSAGTHSIRGLAVGTATAIGCAGIAFIRVNAEPLHQWIVILGRFLLQKLRGTDTWMAPLPLLTGTPSQETLSTQSGLVRRRHRPSGPPLPRCLRGLELRAVPRPPWAGADQTLTPVGLVRDRRHESLTVLMTARGRTFTLVEGADQHAQLQLWGNVLAQFARESSPVIRLGWTLWSTPEHPGHHDGHLAWLAEHTSHTPDLEDVRMAYTALLNDTIVQRHELRIWITVGAGAAPHRAGHRPRLSGRQARSTPAATALAAAQALRDRCTAAGLTVASPMSPVQIAEATRVQADPTITPHLSPSGRGLSERTGIATTLAAPPPRTPAEGSEGRALVMDPVQITPLAVQARWDAVHVDGVWHRAFWIAHWPSAITDATWLHPLLTGNEGTRTLAVSYEPISPRVSRRKITAEAVSVDSQLSVRERHDLRVPVDLRHAHQDIDHREQELVEGHAEVALLALIVLTETSPEHLDVASQALLDQAARAGIPDLRPLHGRHSAAWACTLPLGRLPDQDVLSGLPG